MIFHSVLSTFLSSVETSLQHLRMEFSYHISYVMQFWRNYADFLYRARFATIRLLDMDMLPQDWSHNYRRSLMVVIMNLLIVTVHPAARWEPIYSTCHSLPFLFRLPWTWLFMNKWAAFSRKSRGSTDAPGAHLLLLFCTCYFGYFIFFVAFTVFRVWSLSMDYIILISDNYGSLDYSTKREIIVILPFCLS